MTTFYDFRSFREGQISKLVVSRSAISDVLEEENEDLI